MTRKEFDKLVEEAAASIPAEFHEKMENVAILVEDSPSGDIKKQYPNGLFGVFSGVPLTKQSWWGNAYFPHRIILYQKCIESHCHSNMEIKQLIRITLIHEVGHFFGFDENEIRRLQGLPLEPK